MGPQISSSPTDIATSNGVPLVRMSTGLLMDIGRTIVVMNVTLRGGHREEVG